ncbi:MAG: hypothetical protein ACI8YO_002791 [Gammaproteobacteria bacterium]|jgi:hypothetical protein
MQTLLKPLSSGLNRVLIPLLLCCIASPVSAGEFTGFFAMEHRQFFNDGTYPEQKHGSKPSLIIEPEYYHLSDDENNIFTSQLFLRLDPIDSRRTHFDVRQFDWLYADGDWEFSAGISKVYWGVTESHHLVDIINQVDGVEDVDEEDRLGQPMLQLATFQSWGTVRFFYLPYFRERTFVGKKGRLRGPLVVQTKDARYSSKAKEMYPDVALRYEHSFDAWDMGLAHFHGTSREPTLLEESEKLIPFYEIIDQSSLDLQYTTGSWLWKLEVIGRGGHGKYFGAVTAGGEYSVYGIFETNHDLGLLLECHYDGRDSSAPTANLQNDVFTGLRYILNNVDDTQFLGGITTDLKNTGQLMALEASHRINNNWKLEADARLFINQGLDSPIKALEKDDFVQIRTSYFF